MRTASNVRPSRRVRMSPTRCSVSGLMVRLSSSISGARSVRVRRRFRRRCEAVFPPPDPSSSSVSSGPSTSTPLPTCSGHITTRRTLRGGSTMPEHPNATKAREGLDALNSGDMQAMSDFLDDDVVWHEIGRPEPVRGKAALAAEAQQATGDYTITGKLHDVVANDDHTIALVDATATRGGKTLNYRTAEIMHIRNGKVVERWAFSDDTGAITEFFK